MNRICTIIIPVYNHGRTIAAVAGKTAELGFPVIVVDDGSKPAVDPQIARLPGVRILRHRRNRGKGAALLTGFRAAAAAGARWAITLDADLQHIPADARRLIAAVPADTRPIIVGCRRDMLAAGAPWTSRWGRGFSNFWIRLSGGPPTQDTQSGFRLYPLPEVLHLQVRARRYQYELEVLVKAIRCGIPVRETTIGVMYQTDIPRISHFRPLVDFLRNTGTFSRLIFERITGMAL